MSSPQAVGGPAITFIGLGTMGLPIARLVFARFPDLVAHDRDPGRLAAAGRAGLPVAADVARRPCDVLVVSLNSPQALVDLLTGAASPLRDRPDPVLVLDVGTTGPETSVRLGERLRRRGHRFVDAPVSGGRQGAERGDLTAMVGLREGESPLAEEVLRAFCRRIDHLGEPGLGAAMKLANNALAIGTLALAGDVLSYAEAKGIDRARALDIIAASSGDSRILRSKHRLINRRRYTDDLTFDIRLALKDIRLVLDAPGDVARPELPLLSLVERLVAAVAVAYDEPVDLSAVCDPAVRASAGSGS